MMGSQQASPYMLFAYNKRDYFWSVEKDECKHWRGFQDESGWNGRLGEDF